MSRIKVQEGSRKTGFLSKEYGLGISTVIDDDNPIDEEIRHINEAMINWFKSRGNKCKFMTLVYTANPTLHDYIIEKTETLVNQDFDYNALLENLEVSVLLLDMRGKQCKELEMKKGKSA